MTTTIPATSPALMPRSRRQSATPSGSGTAAVMSMTVEPAHGLLADGHSSYLSCAAVEGTRSPIFAGPREAVLASLARWVSSTAPFKDGIRSPEVQVHRATFQATAEAQDNAVVQAFQRAGLSEASMTYPAGVDPATMIVREVLRGHVSPDVIVLRSWSGKKLQAPRSWPIPGISGTADQDARSGDPLTTAFVRLLKKTRKQWTSSQARLLCSELPALEQPPSRINVYTDASTAPGSSCAAIGMVCPELSMIATGVLPGGWARRRLDTSAAELCAVAAAATLFGQFAGEVLVHSDSVAAVTWWRHPIRVPDRQPWVRDGVVGVQRAVDRAGGSVRARWVKGHADTDGNLWADRAAKLSWRAAEWDESEKTRREKFDRLVDDFARHYSRRHTHLSA